MNKETLDLIYDLIIAYLPSITAVFTCILTLIKCIQAIANSNKDNSMTRDQLKLLREETANMSREYQELKKKLNKLINKQEVSANDKEIS